MSATLFPQSRIQNQEASALSRIHWTRTASPTMKTRRYAMNPNRWLSDQLSSFEGQFFRAQIKFEVRQSNSGVLNIAKDCSENLLKLLLNRMLSVAGKNSTLHFIWSRSEEGLSLQIRLHPSLGMDPRRLPLPLLPQSSPLRAQLREAGITVHSDNSNGPWNLKFDTIDI